MHENDMDEHTTLNYTSQMVELYLSIGIKITLSQKEHDLMDLSSLHLHQKSNCCISKNQSVGSNIDILSGPQSIQRNLDLGNIQTYKQKSIKSPTQATIKTIWL